MKKQILTLFFITGMMMASFGQNKNVCDCYKMQLNYMNDYNDNKYSLEKLIELRDKYQQKISECEKIIGEYRTSIKDLSEKEKEAKKEAFRKECPAFTKVEKNIAEAENAPAPFFFIGIKIGMTKHEIDSLGFNTEEVIKTMKFDDLSVKTLVLEIKNKKGEVIAEAYNEPGNAIKARGYRQIDVLTKENITYKGTRIGSDLNYFVKCYPKAKITWNSVAKKAFITTEFLPNYHFYFSPEAFSKKVNTKTTDYENFEQTIDRKLVDLNTTITELKVFE